MGIIEIGLSFTAIYSSPLKRAYETAEIVSDELGMNEKPTVVKDLIERDFGAMTGKPQADVKALCAPDILETDTITYFLNPEGAETFPELVERGNKVLEQVREAQPEGNALLVCHGDIGKMIYAAATGKPWQDVLRDFHFGNGELIEVSPNDEVHRVKLPQHNL